MRYARPVRHGRTTAIAAVAAAVLTGCQAEEEAPHDGGGDHHAPDLAHIHGIAINPADGKLYAGTHHGLFSIDGKGEPKQIAGLDQDFMGFTVAGPNHFLASGHPGPRSDQPAHLGLIESTDAGKTWKNVALSGEVDFHSLDHVKGGVYGYDSQSAQLMVSMRDRAEWERRARLPLADIAVSVADPNQLIATTQEGPARSTDGGRTFTPIKGAPLLLLVDWPSGKSLTGVSPDGVVHHSADGGNTWSRRGQVTGSPAALSVEGDELYLATDDAIHRSTDGGKTFTMFQSLQT